MGPTRTTPFSVIKDSYKLSRSNISPVTVFVVLFTLSGSLLCLECLKLRQNPGPKSGIVCRRVSVDPCCVGL